MLTKEFVGQAIDSKYIIRYVCITKDRLELNKWFVDHTNKGTFKDLKLKVNTRYLYKGKPLRINARDMAWIINGVLFFYLIYRISSL